MSGVKKVVFSVINFLRNEVQSNSLTEDSKESLEVAIQCLESAYNVREEDRIAVESSPRLLELFESESVPVTEEMKTQAEKLKAEGNNFMKVEKYAEAIAQYDEAIKLDPHNAVYFCNRAAAQSKMANHQNAIRDCQSAIRIDPNYSKAYGRMGLAFANLNNHIEARNCYKTAAHIEPNNESYTSNLKIAEEKCKESAPSVAPGGGMPNIANFLNNPALVNMASSLMADPSMQNMMSSFLSNSGVSGGVGVGSGAVAGAGAGAGPGSGGIDNLLQVGQQLASQMQSMNPELVEQLRQQMENTRSSSDPQPKPDDDPSKPT